MRLERLQLELEGPVARVWLNRPDVRNAFDGLMVTELRRVLFDLRTVSGDELPDLARAIQYAREGDEFVDDDG